MMEEKDTTSKDEFRDLANAALNKMREQGNQLRASELIPVLKAIVGALTAD